MATRKKTVTPPAQKRSDLPKRESVAERRPSRPELTNGHDIAARAYELFLQRGGQHGHDLEDWFSAEKQLSQGER